jgi:hypothetical protein
MGGLSLLYISLREMGPGANPGYTPLSDFLSYRSDLKMIVALMTDGPAKSTCFRKLQFLESKFKMHLMLNEVAETAEQRTVSHRDFYNVRKVRSYALVFQPCNYLSFLIPSFPHVRRDAHASLLGVMAGYLCTGGYPCSPLGLYESKAPFALYQGKDQVERRRGCHSEGWERLNPQSGV